MYKLFFFFFFFFKQKTAYEMRISDWSSDVCSSDLIAGEAKWRNRLTQSAVDTLMLGDYEDGEDEEGERVRNGRGVWFEINRDMPVPYGLRQLQRLLELSAPENYAAAILSIDRAIAIDGTPLPRTNLSLISGKGDRRREAGGVLSPL